MKKFIVTLFLVVLANFSFALDLGVKGGYMNGATDLIKDYSGFVLGVDTSYGLGPVALKPEVLYFSAKDVSKLTDVAINLNAVLTIPVIGIYGGVGVGVNFLKPENRDSESKFGTQFMLGYELQTPFISPFLELRYVMLPDDLSHIMALAGVNISL